MGLMAITFSCRTIENTALDFVGRLNKPIMGYLTLILNVRVKNDQIKEWIIIQNLLKFRVGVCMIYQVSVLF